MINIPQDEAQKRFQSIPEELQNAIFSLHNAEIIDKIAEENNLSETKQRAVAKLIGYVFLGFLDYKDDLAREIAKAIGISPDGAKKISDSLKSRIFSSLRGELSLAYQPLSAAEGKGLPFQIGAMPAQVESRKSMPTGRQIKVESISSTPTTTTTSTTPIGPVMPPRAAIPAGAAAPSPISVNAPLPPAPEAAEHKAQSASPLTSTILTPPSSTTIKTPITPSGPAVPAPFILHQEAESQPLAQQKSKLSFQFTPSRDALQKDMGKPVEILKPKAQIEIGNEAESSKFKVESKSFFAPSGPAGTQQAPDAQRVVHYSAFRTPVYAPGPVNNEKQNVIDNKTQIVPPSPTLPTPPATPTRPTIPSSPKFITDRFASPAISARPTSPAVSTAPSLPISPKIPTIPAVPVAPSPTTFPTPKTIRTSITPTMPPATPPKMADIIAAGKPVSQIQTSQTPTPTKRVDYK